MILGFWSITPNWLTLTGLHDLLLTRYSNKAISAYGEEVPSLRASWYLHLTAFFSPLDGNLFLALADLALCCMVTSCLTV